MNARSFLTLVVAIGAIALSGCASQPQTEWDGLVPHPHPRLGAVWVKPDAEIVAYRNVMLDPVQVSFARNWDPNRGGRSNLGRLSADDMAGIKETVANLFVDVFRTELGRGGYTLVDQPGPDTLRVTAAIVDLYITAPDTGQAGRTRTYTASSGRMVLVLEARDSITGEILARVVDGRSGRSGGTLSFTNRVTNTADARRAMGIWARAMREGLDELYQRAATATPAAP